MEGNQQDVVAAISSSALTDEQVIQLQANLIELAHDAILIRDPENRILVWNRGAQALYGWSEQEALGKISHDLLHTQFPTPPEEVESALKLHGSWEGQLVHTNRDGSLCIVDSRQVLVTQAGGLTSAILEVNRDITRQERLLSERAEMQADEIALRETTGRMDAFMSIISHELKTPLTALNGNIQLARRQFVRLLRVYPMLAELAADDMSSVALILKFLERAEHQIALQSRLINDLVDVSRIENNQLSLHQELCDLVQITNRVVDEQRLLTPLRQIVWNCSLEKAEVCADADRIGQVVHNYLSNALKYSEDNQPVIVRLEQADNQFRVCVQDAGPGLSLDQQKHIWKRFYRVQEIEVKS
ncbi:MAG TPA: PAS domain-containing protein, partial [Ktedonobacteraceae bacterium]|nr:PAS domain-containing protein [Ktedonobacteraceae bacterium]